MVRLRNSVATLALMALTSTAVPPLLAQDQPAVEAEDLDSLVDSLSDPDAVDDVEPLAEEELLTDAELDELVAPVALYPDALLAQVLVASTYPLQIVKADRIVATSEDMTDEELSETLSEQEFDPSVLVLLSGFPTVVGRMAEDLDWTERLGIAILQQDDDVLAAVQRMRADARDMGYLSSNDAQTVEEEDGQIYVAPADPEVVYVPTYDPSVVYTSPAPAEPYYVAPAQSTSPWSAQSLITGGVIGFGAALLVDELWGDDDDDDDNDWDGYWGRPRPIAWQDREFYPRPYWNRNRAEQARAWSWERDRYWRRSDDGWRREAARDRREAAVDRRDALGYLGASPEGVRNARERGPWRDLEARERRARAADERQREDQPGGDAEGPAGARQPAGGGAGARAPAGGGTGARAHAGKGSGGRAQEGGAGAGAPAGGQQGARTPAGRKGARPPREGRGRAAARASPDRGRCRRGALEAARRAAAAAGPSRAKRTGAAPATAGWRRPGRWRQTGGPAGGRQAAGSAGQRQSAGREG